MRSPLVEMSLQDRTIWNKMKGFSDDDGYIDRWWSYTAMHKILKNQLLGYGYNTVDILHWLHKRGAVVSGCWAEAKWATQRSIFFQLEQLVFEKTCRLLGSSSKSYQSSPIAILNTDSKIYCEASTCLSSDPVRSFPLPFRILFYPTPRLYP